jgi:hypothetical protein
MFKNILIKKRKLFIRNKGKWLNVNLEVSANGGGWKGLKEFIKGVHNCRKGKHRYQTVFEVQSLTSSIRCCYCNSEKKEKE